MVETWNFPCLIEGSRLVYEIGWGSRTLQTLSPPGLAMSSREDIRMPCVGLPHPLAQSWTVFTWTAAFTVVCQGRQCRLSPLLCADSCSSCGKCVCQVCVCDWGGKVHPWLCWTCSDARRLLPSKLSAFLLL